jgi:ATP-independent RNA helicase DbpA
LRKATLKLEFVTMLVLDEADRMLGMGFQDTIDRIPKGAPPQSVSTLIL